MPQTINPWQIFTRAAGNLLTQLDAMLSKSNFTLQRFVHAISTPSGLDATLATICYTSLLLHTQSTGVSVPSTTSSALRNLYNLLEDTRIYTRLTGLSTLYTVARETWATQHRDPVIKILLCTSIAAGTSFQLLENIALLVQQNVLRSKKLRQREGCFWTASDRCWVVALLCDLARLLRERRLGSGEEAGEKEVVCGKSEADGGGDSLLMHVESGMMLGEREKKWWQELFMTAALIPLAINWSFPEGDSPVSETLLAAAGLASGLVMLRDALEEAA